MKNVFSDNSKFLLLFLCCLGQKDRKTITALLVGLEDYAITW